jgi:N-acetylglutamate synthase-like GNAT family acetyltransferase
MKLSFKTPSEEEFDKIRNYIQAFELDNRLLLNQQFIAAYSDDKIVGFGRLREHPDSVELCSLGVLENKRNSGIGEALVRQLISKAPQQLYLVCIIPDFFSPLGFVIVNEYPDSIKNKYDYCTSELIVPETYVVMKYQPKE